VHGLGRQGERSGAALDASPPLYTAARPTGEWNRARIVARGRDVEHWLNGVKVLALDVPAQRAPIELGVRGDPDELPAALAHLVAGVEAGGFRWEPLADAHSGTDSGR